MTQKPGTLSQFVTEFSKDDVLTQAAALSFYTTLALAPLLILLLTLLGALSGGMQERLLSELIAVGGANVEPFLRQLIESADNRPNLRQLAGWGAFATLVFSASVLFAQLQSAMNRIWDAENAKLAGAWGFIRRRLLSIGMLMTLVFLTIATLIVQAALHTLPHGEGWIWMSVGAVLALAVYTFLFAALYRWLPDRRVPWSTALKGGAITAVMFMLGRAVIGLYLAHSDAAGAFGAASSVILWLLWTYYIGIVFLAAAELVAVLAERRGWAWFDRRTRPS